jgi:cytochrome d ubiquinol oxidase subunit I
MTDLIAARTQMAMSLGFHIVFAVLGIAMPALIAVAEWRWLSKGDTNGLSLAKRWSKGTAILFAVGAVSGTVLSFELGLLWPTFMERAGPSIGPLFALEGFAFFTEAIFLGIYLYGWSRIPPPVHFLSGLIVVASGIASAVFVVAANAWMNAPSGFVVQEGHLSHIDPVAPLWHPVAWHRQDTCCLGALLRQDFSSQPSMHSGSCENQTVPFTASLCRLRLPLVGLPRCCSR